MSEPTYHWIRPHQGIERALIPGSSDVVTGNATEATLAAWIEEVNRRGIDLDNWKKTFADMACKALSPEMRAYMCQPIDNNDPDEMRSDRISGVGDVIRFLETIKDWWRGNDSVSQELADSRAAVCMSCPYNQEPHGGGCASCTGIAQTIVNKTFSVIGGLKTKHDHALKACSRCRCSISVMVHVPLETLLKHQEGVAPLPSYCWKLTEKA